MSRRKISNFAAVFLLAFQIVALQGCFLFQEISETNKNKGLSQEFDDRMKTSGFAKNVVVFDFLKDESYKRALERSNKYWWTVGIWLNYQEKLVALRLDRINWNEVVIPFDKILKITIIEDGFTETTGHIGYFGGVRATSNEMSKGLDVRIVAGDTNTGTNAYILKLYDPKYGATLKKSDPLYRSIQECANSIFDEIELIMKSN